MTRSLWTVFVALITASQLWPAEEAYDGAGLHWVALWLTVGLATCLVPVFRRLRSHASTAQTNEFPQRFTLVDMSWFLIVLGQWVSTAIVFREFGDRRTALNLSFEWLGLLVAGGLVRAAVANKARRRGLATLVISLAAGLSAYAMAQHYIVFSNQASWYQSRRSELDQLIADRNPRAVLRIAEIESEFQRNDIPLSGSQRVQWQQRLLNSSEPTATFALANTLAGILAAALVALAGSMFQHRSHGPQRKILRISLGAACFLVVAYALVLTKSRTAWVGCAAGFGWLAVGGWQHRTANAKRPIKLLLAGGLILAGVVGAAGYSGALDKEVISESPRSLQFRLLYWAGTAGLLRQSPIFGVGPGNFRQGYLPHKLPESSEEIRDPHNMILESWTSGGLISLVGVLLGLGAIIRMMIGRQSASAGHPANGVGLAAEFNSASPPDTAKEASRWSVMSGLIGGFGFHSAWQWLNGAHLAGDALSWLLLPSVTLFVAAAGRRWWVPLENRTALAAVICLGTHLMGAGGFQTPAVMLMLLILLKSADSASEASPVTRIPRILTAGFSAVVCLTGLAVVVAWGLIPVVSCRNEVAEAREIQIRGNLRAAADRYRAAGNNDELAVLPRQHLAELASYRLMSAAARAESGGPSDDELTRTALDVCGEYVAVDRRNVAAFRTRAECRELIAKLTDNQSLPGLAVEDRQQVVAMYPSSAKDWLMLSRTAGNTGQEQYHELSRRAATEALRIEAINRDWGHSDKYFSEDQIRELTRLRQEP